MAKNVEITDRIQQLITATQGDGVEFDQITVFEASVASTRPLTKTGTLFESAVLSEDLLRQMAAGLNSGQFAVPLHTLHGQGFELPVGRVFNAEVLQSEDGGTELRAMFFLGEDQTDIISRINTSVIDEVSVGLLSKQMLCSECGFDFLGPESDFDNLFNRTCCNEHTVGEDGVFVRLIGLDRWLELSLVSLGASSKPKILGRTKQRLGEEAHRRIAADGSIPEVVVLYAQSKGFQMPGDKKSKSGGDAKVDLSPITEALDATNTAIASLGETMTNLQADVAELKAEPRSSKTDDEVKVLQVSLDESVSKVSALEASETELKEQIVTLEASETELKAQVTKLEASAALKVDGVAASAISDASASNSNLAGRLKAFKTPK